MDEWLDMFKSCNDKSTSGYSNIGFKLLKKAGNNAHHIFIKFLEIIFHILIFLKEWTITQIFLIPNKPKSWEYKLNNTRLILLLEYLRKAYVKILSNHLSLVLSHNNILQGSNFAGLPESSTKDPIHILNNIMEDAHEQGKEC